MLTIHSFFKNNGTKYCEYTVHYLDFFVGIGYNILS